MGETLFASGAAVVKPVLLLYNFWRATPITSKRPLETINRVMLFRGFLKSCPHSVKYSHTTAVTSHASGLTANGKIHSQQG